MDNWDPKSEWVKYIVQICIKSYKILQFQAIIFDV